MAYGFFSVYRGLAYRAEFVQRVWTCSTSAGSRQTSDFGVALQQVEYRQKIKDLDLLKQVLIPEQLLRYDQPRTDKGCY